jgi:phosphodiesterase/alkaline phosphatase D-like protein
LVLTGHRIGGGDQIYNDGIRVAGPLHDWSNIGNPKKRKDHPFPESLRQQCDDYYLKNYIRWYSTEPFANANGQIAQLNIWDDHDVCPLSLEAWKILTM